MKNKLSKNLPVFSMTATTTEISEEKFEKLSTQKRPCTSASQFQFRFATNPLSTSHPENIKLIQYISVYVLCALLYVQPYILA